MLSVSCNSSREGTQLRSSGGERWPGGEEELVLDRQVQYSSGLESSSPDGFDYILQLRGDGSGSRWIWGCCREPFGLMTFGPWLKRSWTLSLNRDDGSPLFLTFKESFIGSRRWVRMVIQRPLFSKDFSFKGLQIAGSCSIVPNIWLPKISRRRYSFPLIGFLYFLSSMWFPLKNICISLPLCVEHKICNEIYVTAFFLLLNYAVNLTKKWLYLPSFFWYTKAVCL